MLYAVAAAVLLAIVLWILLKRRRPSAAHAAPEPDEATPKRTVHTDAGTYEIDPSADEDRLNPRPRAPVQSADACWVPPGRAVTVHGYTIARGMVYVGAGLYRDRVAWKPEDCLIDPTLDVSADDPDAAGRTVPFWPAYGKLNPSARAAYLAFVAGGAGDPEAHPGYVMLYFYGLRRRLTKDRLPAGEADVLVEEVRRLRALYGHHAFFDEAATKLLGAVGGGEKEV